MKLTYAGIGDKAAWAAAKIALPTYDPAAMAEHTRKHPHWVHFGAGNIFRAFPARMQDALLCRGEADTGIIAAETFDFDIVDKVYAPHDNLCLSVGLRANGDMVMDVVASVAESIRADAGFAHLKEIFRNPELQMASFTITEKGYALRGMDGSILGVVAADMENGPAAPKHAMSMVAALLLERFAAGAHPIAMVSMDNCSQNGKKLRAAVTEVARAWHEKGFAGTDFLAYVEDETRVSFPWSMIDKITPRPAKVVEDKLASLGVEDVSPIVTGRGTYIAPFVNAEIPQYLVVEDNFPAGRPALEKAGVYFVTRDVVNQTERMKVTTCLNPLHTALAVYGCVLGYESIAAEMQDAELTRLVEKIGAQEGMPVVTDPGIFRPIDFLREVMEQRLPNPFIPDTPQRIATDTSQKVGIRFGETIKSYMASAELNAASLTGIPLAIAGWLRYLMGVDDAGKPFDKSGDPMMSALEEIMAGVTLGDASAAKAAAHRVLSNQSLFGVDLRQAGLEEKIAEMFAELAAGPGAVRKTLQKYLG